MIISQLDCMRGSMTCLESAQYNQGTEENQEI